MQKRPDIDRIRTVLARSVHFRDFAPAELDHLAELGHIRKLKDAQVGPPDGGHGRHFFVIVSGCIRLSSATREGAEFVYAMLGPGSFYGIGNVIRGIDTRAHAHAAGATELAVMDGPAFLALLDASPALWRHVAVMLHKRLTHAMWAIRDNSVAPLRDRVVRRLLAHGAASGADLAAGAVALRLTQTDLGRMLGTSRSRINGVLKSLERDGLLKIGYRTIALHDVAGLQKVAGADVFSF